MHMRNCAFREGKFALCIGYFDTFSMFRWRNFWQYLYGIGLIVSKTAFVIGLPHLDKLRSR